MCLVMVVWRAHPQYPCLIAANRDEFHARPTEPARWWSGDSGILAGRDLSAGGTWLGVTRSGRFAALTNYRGSGQKKIDAPSRGALVSSILQSTSSTGQILTHLSAIGDRYNGFNVIFSDGLQLGVFESTVGVGRELGPGMYGLSNHVLDTPWPKIRNAKDRLSQALMHDSDNGPLLSLLRDDRPASDEELPRTGVSVEWERLLSSAFIRSPDYGTRCSTIIRIDRSGRACFDEWSWDASGADVGRVSLRFDVE